MGVASSGQVINCFGPPRIMGVSGERAGDQLLWAFPGNGSFRPRRAAAKQALAARSHVIAVH
eukprot:358817-Chlamydomonas_euryale.AAC.3